MAAASTLAEHQERIIRQQKNTLANQEATINELRRELATADRLIAQAGAELRRPEIGAYISTQVRDSVIEFAGRTGHGR